jgi:hypothetical protein
MTDDDLEEFAIYWFGSDTDERTVTDVIEDGSLVAFVRALSSWGFNEPSL